MTERPVVFSASSVSAYQACHLQWWFTYVLGEPGEQSEPQRVGIELHDYAERLLRDPETPPLTDPVLRPLADVFDNQILPTYRNAVLIEAHFQLEVNGIPYSGVIDSVDVHHIGPLPEVDWDSEGRDLIDPYPLEYDAKILRDLKTTGSRPTRGRYRFAMTGYWLGATILGHEPDAAQLDWIVRTRSPYYWPEVLDPVTDDDIAAFAVTLELAAEGVARGDYLPTGLGTWACKTCPYTAVCGPYQRYQEVIDG